METRPDRIRALRHWHEALQAVAGPLDASQLERRLYASQWSIAQVLSHLGSQAEIFSLLLDAAWPGMTRPGRLRSRRSGRRGTRRARPTRRLTRCEPMRP